MPVFSSVSSGRHCIGAVTQTHLFPLSSPAPHPFRPVPCSIVTPLPFLSVSLIHTQGYLFFHWVEPQCQVKASIGRIKRVAGVRSQGPTLPSKPWSEAPGWSFKQSAPSFIIHATALKISFRNTISSPLSLSLSHSASLGFSLSIFLPLFPHRPSSFSLVFFPDRASIKYE